MTPSLHHVVFAVADERHESVAQMFIDLGFALAPAELTELGVRINLDWARGIEIISPLPGATASVAKSVSQFLAEEGDGIYTVVLQVPAASAAEAVAERYGSKTRFRQSFSGDGTFLDEIDLSALGLPLTFLATNVP
jgi:4-hydroxyphenylpyruvate dioxygenase-like putative hemolysin